MLLSSRFRPLALAALFVAASAVTALDYGVGPGEPALQARRDIHRSVFNRTATDPDRYRVLTPLMVEGAVRAIGPTAAPDAVFDRVYAVFYVAAMAAMLWALFAYAREWFSDEQALIAVLLVASTLRITIRQHNYAPASYLEPTFLALGLLLMRRDRLWLLGLLIALATLNRETAIFLVLLFAATQPWTARTLKALLGYGAIWVAIFAGVRYLLGPGERYWDVERIWRTNLSQPGLTIYNLTAFLGVVWILAAAGWSHAPVFVRRTALVIPAYLAAIAVWGIWWEVRLLMPVLPIVLTLALSALFPAASAAGRLGEPRAAL